MKMTPRLATGGEGQREEASMLRMKPNASHTQAHTQTHTHRPHHTALDSPAVSVNPSHGFNDGALSLI